MRRGAKPGKAKVKTRRPVARKSPKVDASGHRELERRLAESLEREKAKDRALTEALDQQTATSDILRVISQSQTDVQPVFDAILASAVRLLRADTGVLTRVAGDQIELAALRSTDAAGDAALRATFPRPLESETPHAQVIRERAPLNIADTQRDPRLSEAVHSAARVRGIRSQVVVPLLRDDEAIGAIGAIGVSRREPAGFTDDEIALLQTFADQAVIAIENVRLFTELEARTRDVTATAEILQVISRSPTDAQPVFDAIAERAVTLCSAAFGAVFRFNDGWLNIAALSGMRPEEAEAAQGHFPRRLTPGGPGLSRVAVTGELVHIPDVQADPKWRATAAGPAFSAAGFRTCLIVPLNREGLCLGAINVWRREAAPFSESQIALLATFADQAVIAIENVRLFTALQQRNRDVSEALEQQTATSEILQVISSSPTDVQPVFDTIAQRAKRLCDARECGVFTFDGVLIHLVALADAEAASAAMLRSAFPRAPGRDSFTARAILTGSIVHSDTLTDLEFDLTDAVRASNIRRTLSVPMRREGEVIGAITVDRYQPDPFLPKQIELLQTFASQAVIALGNVRLFTELRTSNRELSAALETQMATSDILRVINRSQTDVQPVFDAILASAVHLLRGYSGALTRMAGDQIELAALTSTDAVGEAATRAFFPMSPQSELAYAYARIIRDRAPVNIADTETDPRVPEAGRAIARARGFRSWVIVPLLRQDEAIGAIGVTRRDPGGFSDDEIALLQTFADQAVIAIENVRLFTELEARTLDLTRSVDELTALGDVSRALSATLDLETVLQTIVTRAVQIAGTAGCNIWEYDEPRAEFRLRASHYADQADATLLQAPGRVTAIPRGQGVTSRVMERREPVQIADITIKGAYESPIRQPLIEAGHRALLGVPLLSENEVIGVLAVTRKTAGEFEPEIVRLLSTFATQSALAIQNARLFREIEDKSRQLEAASQHKSEFLANMSHELRTPLNAILGFSEVLADGMFGGINEKQEEYLRDILESGRHLLSLINDILDLSKIEAGRMELEPADFDLPGAIDNALILVRERATRRGIALGQAIDDRVGVIQGDERKVKQVLLNLLSNALKFTPEGGRIDVQASVNENMMEVSVSDTGVGIAPDDQEAVFEEFRQVGTADKKVEGTGLGLALSRKFIELHGGRIWVKSQVGQGSTFTFTLPLRRED